MTTRFLHAADIHLGYQQYGSKERSLDFFAAFKALVDDALARRVDFVLLAGDLFHKRIIEPLTLLWTVNILERLREARIPVLAVEGNHERPHYHEEFSWLDYLNDVHLLTLLTPRYEQGQIRLRPWTREETGAYIDLPGGIRVVGCKYYGASTPHVVRDLTAALAEQPGERPAYTIVMLHAGIEGILDNYSATLTRAQLDPLRPHADYLALGHIHKPFIQDDWIHNPGSLETNSMTEVEWDDRGYFLVEVDPARSPAHEVTKVRSRRRAFERLVFSLDPYDTPEALYAGIERYLASQATPQRVEKQPVVDLYLTGVLNFEVTELSLPRIEAMVKEAFRPLVCRVRDGSTPNDYDIRVDATMTRAELEQHVIRELLERDVRRRGDSGRWTQMVLQLKQMALARSAPEEIVAELRAFRDQLQEEAC